MRLFPSFECYGFAVFMHFCQTLDLVQVISSGFSSSDVQQNKRIELEIRFDEGVEGSQLRDEFIHIRGGYINIGAIKQ